MYNVTVNPAIFERFPGYAVEVIYASGVVNSESTAKSIATLREAEATARGQFVGERPVSHPHVAAWREVYRDFGAKPSKYLCSVEALLGRTLKGNDLPPINAIVDLYNAVSISHVLPAGGEDRDKLTSDIVLTFANGDEPFDAMSTGEVEHPEPGEVIWADASGVTCRRWNWRQCARTQITPATTNIYFILDTLSPFTPEQLQSAGDALVAGLEMLSPGCEIERLVLDSHSHSG